MATGNPTLGERILQPSSGKSGVISKQKVIDDSQHRYEFIVNTSRELMAFINRNFVYEAVNDAYCQARSQTREEIIGSTMADLWGQDVFDAVIRESMERCLNGEEVKYQAWYDHAALGRRYMDVAYYPYRNHRHEVTHAVVVTYDATRYILAEQRTLRYATRLEILQEIDRAILAGQPLESIAQNAIDGLQNLLPAHNTSIVLFEDDSEWPHVNGRPIFSADGSQMVSWQIRMPRSATPRRLADSANDQQLHQAGDLLCITLPAVDSPPEAVSVHDAHVETHQQTPASLISMPITSQSSLLGAVLASAEEARAFSEQDLDIVREVAYHLALGIQQRRMERAVQRHTTSLEELVQARTSEIERRRRVAEGLRDVLGELNLSHSLDQISQYIAEQAHDVIDASSATVYILDRPEAAEAELKWLRQRAKSTSELSLRAFHSSETDAISKNLDAVNRRAMEEAMVDVVPAQAEASGQAASSPHRVFVGHAEREGSVGRPIVVPLVLREEALGAIVLQRPEQDALTQEDFDVLLALGDQSALAVENAMLYRRAEEAGVLEERGRLARDLHDAVTQSLYSLVLFAEAGRRLVGQHKPDLLTSHLSQLGITAQQALKEMRLLLFDLRPLTLEEEGLAGALEQRLNAVEKRAGISATIDIESAPYLAPATEEALYRIAQEALNNSLKHSFASKIHVALRGVPVAVSQMDWEQAGQRADAKALLSATQPAVADSLNLNGSTASANGRQGENHSSTLRHGAETKHLLEVTLTISDDGRGFNMNEMEKLQSSGMGLSNIHERVEKLNGKLTIQSAPQAGTQIIIRLLVDEEN